MLIHLNELVSSFGFIAPHLIEQLNLKQVILFILNQPSFDLLFSPFLPPFFEEAQLIYRHDKVQPLPLAIRVNCWQIEKFITYDRIKSLYF